MLSQSRFPRPVLVLVVLSGMIASAVFAGMLVTGAFGEDNSTKAQLGEKTAEAYMTNEAATNETLPHLATKSYHTPLPVTLQPCPIDTRTFRTQISGPPAYASYAAQLYPEIFGTRDSQLLKLVNKAFGLTTEGAPYTIWSGALTSDPQQGVIVTWLGAKDPCAEGQSYYPAQEYLTPLRGGAVTLKLIEGDMLHFQTADGSNASLDYVTGAFTFQYGTPYPTAAPTAIATATQ